VLTILCNSGNKFQILVIYYQTKFFKLINQIIFALKMTIMFILKSVASVVSFNAASVIANEVHHDYSGMGCTHQLAKSCPALALQLSTATQTEDLQNHQRIGKRETSTIRNNRKKKKKKIIYILIKPVYPVDLYKISLQ
jgi:hypothetical protein